MSDGSATGSGSLQGEACAVAPARSAAPATMTGRLPAAGRLGAAGLRQGFLDHGGELYGFAARALQDHGRAEDAVQETFVRAWRSRHRFDPELGSLRTWLFAIERRVLLDVAMVASKHSHVELDEGLVALEEDWIDAALSRWQVGEALARLDERHRRVLDELYLQGRTSKEVAARVSIPEGTVRSRAFYALRVLRARLTELGFEP